MAVSKRPRKIVTAVRKTSSTSGPSTRKRKPAAKAQPKASAPRPYARVGRTKAQRKRARAFPQLRPSEVLQQITAFSREVTSELPEEALFETFYACLQRLLPGRCVALRVIDPRTLLVTDVLSPPDARLTEDARERPATLPRAALEASTVRNAVPRDLVATDGSGRTLRVADHVHALFQGALAGFSIALAAGGTFIGEIHVDYPPNAPTRPPVKADRAVVAPFANHVAGVAHTRRLLRQTQSLQESLARLIDQANVLLFAVDAAGKVSVWNRALSRLTGFSPQDALSRDVRVWFRDLGAGDLASALAEVFSSGEAAQRELRVPSAAGHVLRVTMNVVAVRDHDGAVTSVLAIGQDVTALRELQRQVIHAEKLSTVGQIAAGVAHEINNPLTSIQVCTEALLRKSSRPPGTPLSFDESDVDRVKKIKEGAERIRRFARDLVTYARPSGSDIEGVSVNEVIEQGLSFCEHVVDDARAHVECELGELPRVQAVRDQLLQVVINLVTNAAHAVAPAGGVIRLRSWKAGAGSVGFTVTDTGVGIKAENRSKVFDPFFTTKPAGRGTGLGLSVVRNIVYAHGGTITFQSKPGSGTTFVVTLPLVHHGALATGDLPPI